MDKERWELDSGQKANGELPSASIDMNIESTCREEIKKFFSISQLFGLGTTLLGGTTYLIALVLDSSSETINAITNANIFIFIFFLGLCLITEIMASGKHINALYERGRDKYKDAGDNIEQLSQQYVKIACTVELYILGVICFIISQYISRYFGVKSGLQPGPPKNYTCLLLSICGSCYILGVLLQVLNLWTPNFMRRVQYRQTKADDQRITVAEHVGLVWGVNGVHLIILQHWLIYVCLVMYSLLVLILAQETSDPEANSEADSISSLLYALFVQSGYHFVVMIAPSYLIYLTIGVFLSVRSMRSMD